MFLAFPCFASYMYAFCLLWKWNDYDVQEFLLLFCRLACVYVVGFMSVLSLSVLSKIACVYAVGFHVSSQFVSTE